RLYDHFAAALTAVDPQLRFGGPGIAGDERFLRAFLEHCAKGTNFATGQKGTRLDFASLHAVDPAEARARWRREIEKSFPELARAAVFVIAPPAGSPGAAAGPDAAVRLCAQASSMISTAHPGDLCFQEAQ